MQAIRDAAILAVLGLVLVTVRVETGPNAGWDAPAMQSEAGAVSLPAAEPEIDGAPETLTLLPIESLRAPAAPHRCDHDPERTEQIEMIDADHEVVVLIRERSAPDALPAGADCT